MSSTVSAVGYAAVRASPWESSTASASPEAAALLPASTFASSQSTPRARVARPSSHQKDGELAAAGPDVEHLAEGARGLAFDVGDEPGHGIAEELGANVVEAAALGGGGAVRGRVAGGDPLHGLHPGRRVGRQAIGLGRLPAGAQAARRRRARRR